MSLNGHLDLNVGGRSVRVEVRQEGARLHLAFPFNRALIDEVKAMVGRRWDKEARSWSVAYCDRNLLQLRVLAGSEPDEFSRYLAEPPEVQPHRDILRRHQRRALNHGWHKRRLGLAAWMGTGKTLVAFEEMELVKDRFPDASFLYVSKDKVLAATQLEARKWGLKVKPTYVTFDSLRRLLEEWRPGRPAPRMVVFDECTALKNPTAKRTEAAAALLEAMAREHGDDYWALMMSGTPAPQDHCDWWSPTELLYPGWLRESTVHAFRQRLGIIEQQQGASGSFPKLIGWKPEEVALLPRRLAGVWLVINLSDTDLDLPPPQYETIMLPPADELARAAWLVATTANGGADALNKLRQLSDGFQYGADDEPTKEIASPKEKALSELLDRHAVEGRFITYAAYTHSVDRVAKLTADRGWQVLQCDGRGWKVLNSRKSRDDLLMLLQTCGDEEMVCYVGHPGAGGYGLNMQGVRAMCFYSNDFNAEARIQAEARPQRPGNKGLTIYDLCHLGTDQLVISRLKAKLNAQLVTLDEIRAALINNKGAS